MQSADGTWKKTTTFQMFGLCIYLYIYCTSEYQYPTAVPFLQWRIRTTFEKKKNVGLIKSYGRDNISYVGLISYVGHNSKSNVGLIISYVGDNKSYIGYIISYVGDNKSYVGLSKFYVGVFFSFFFFSYVALIRHRTFQGQTLIKGRR